MRLQFHFNKPQINQSIIINPIKHFVAHISYYMSYYISRTHKSINTRRNQSICLRERRKPDPPPANGETQPELPYEPDKAIILLHERERLWRASPMLLSEVVIDGKEIAAQRELILSINIERIELLKEIIIIDGKLERNLCGTKSSATCFVCGTNPKDMTQLETPRQRPLSAETFEYGISWLQAWIKFVGCSFHGSYRIPVRSWRS